MTLGSATCTKLTHPSSWSDETFISSYINLPIFAILYFGYKFIKKTKIVPLKEMPIRPFLKLMADNPEPEPIRPSGLGKLNILWA